jgi:Xaa-Pro aminopeptidase
MLRLTAEGCKNRREQLVKATGADFLIINNPRHIQYLAGVFVTQLSLSGWGTNILTIDAATGESRLLAHNFIAGAAEQAFVDKVEIWRWYDASHNPGTDPHRDAIAEFNARLPSLSGKRVGTEIGWLPIGVNVTNPIDITATLLEMRRRKQPDEMALIREAIQVVGAGHRGARVALRPGVNELDVYNAIQSAMVTQAGFPVLLICDLASGERANAGGGPPIDRVVQAGEMLIVDLFPVVNGYKGDYTVTLSVDGKLTDKQQALETALHEGMTVGESLLKPGTRAGDVYTAIKRKLAEHGFGEGFTHHAGHGLGLGHPDAPYFVPNSDEIIVAGDVVTLEPGSYGPDFGARIEHNYLITDSGFERLSQHNTRFGRE